MGYKLIGYRLPLDRKRVIGTGVVGTIALGPVTVPAFLSLSVRDIALFTKLTAQSKPWEGIRSSTLIHGRALPLQV